jgi:hypothetical protein
MKFLLPVSMHHFPPLPSSFGFQALPVTGPQTTICGVSLSVTLTFMMFGMGGRMWRVFSDRILNLQHGWRAGFFLRWKTGNRDSLILDICVLGYVYGSMDDERKKDNDVSHLMITKRQIKY